jgi:hypothetical protein
MGNRMSFHELYRREDGEVNGSVHQQVHNNNGPRFNGWWLNNSGAQDRAVSGNQSCSALADGYDPDCYEIPASQFQAPTGQREGPRRQNVHAAPAAARVAFDFNDNEQPLPWNAGNERPKPHEAPIPVRALYQTDRTSPCEGFQGMTLHY